MTITEKYNNWLAQPKLDGVLKEQLEAMNEADIEDAFYTELEFGTAGMRGIMGPGTNRMNIYTIRKANVGFAKYLLENETDAKTKGVAIAYDSRHQSYAFALESAVVLGTYGIKTYVFESPRPTPELSFAVRNLGCVGGIVITASHNPPAYNGYKIYDASGSQVLPDATELVIAGVNAVKDVFEIEVLSAQELQTSGLIEMIGEAVDTAYIEAVKTIQLNPQVEKSDLSIVFTPLHGTAGDLVNRLLVETGYTNVSFVKEQTQPDGDFPTVTYPNPEEPAAFTMAEALGKEVGADILLATDPDADRMGVAVAITDTNYSLNNQTFTMSENLTPNEKKDYLLLSGNQTGALMVYYILTQKKEKGTLPTKGRVFDTIVSSALGRMIAQSFGMTVTSTLTGFKFIGEQARLMEDTDETYVFGYEESYGSLVSDFVRDKDALQAVLLLSEAAAYYKTQGKTLNDVLHEIYKIYGYYEEALENISLTGKSGSEKIKTLLATFRSAPPVEVAGVKVVKIYDYLTQRQRENGGETVIDLPTSDVLKYVLADGSWFVIRPSGTEPKAKIYIGAVTDCLSQTSQRVLAIKADVLALVNQILK